METPLKIDLLTLFPEMVEGYFRSSMLGRAVENGLLEINLHNIRNWAKDKHKITDDRPYGGGAGMVMKPEPIVDAIEALRSDHSTVIYMAPDGDRLTRSVSQEFSIQSHLIILSGHYEGIDQRVRDGWIDREISIGDYVLTNGTLAAAVFVDSVSRFVPGVLGEPTSTDFDSFANDQLSFPQYTRPEDFRGHKVPDVLLSGNHGEIENWRALKQINKTSTRRPDLAENHLTNLTII